MIDTYSKFVGGGKKGKLHITVVKEFTCENGSGTFIVKLQIYSAGDSERFSWVVQGGTGVYERLRGSARGYTDDRWSTDVLDPAGSTNTCDGFVINR